MCMIELNKILFANYLVPIVTVDRQKESNVLTPSSKQQPSSWFIFHSSEQEQSKTKKLLRGE